MSSYVPLWCKSNFSFLEGASHPDELVEEAYRLGIAAVALTDRDGVYGVVRAHVKAREIGLKLIIGSEVTLDDGGSVV
ncbi:MAG: PHP domain-containing protein, partial [Candidatus Binatia bacterium]